MMSVAAGVPGSAQSRRNETPEALTAEDYARAEQFMGYNTTPLVSGAAGRPTFLAGDRFWYRNPTADGSEFVLVDPVARTRAPAFDQARLAAALSEAAGATYDAFHLPFTTFKFSADERMISFDVDQDRWTCDLEDDRCAVDERAAALAAKRQMLAPDGTRAVFIRDYNLWVRDVETGQETRLTEDGVATSAMPRTMPGGERATARSSSGRRTRSRSRPFSKISAASARCTWWRPGWGIRRCTRGCTRSRATRSSRRSSGSWST